jgi:hypothetical protein
MSQLPSTKKKTKERTCHDQTEKERARQKKKKLQDKRKNLP